MSQEVHCPVCHRLLATEFEGIVQLKCHSCKTVVKVMTNGSLLTKPLEYVIGKVN